MITSEPVNNTRHCANSIMKVRLAEQMNPIPEK